MPSTPYSIQQWNSFNQSEKTDFIHTLCKTLNTENSQFEFSELLSNNFSAGVLKHVQTEEEFIYIPGGTLVMGFALDDIFSCAQTYYLSEIEPDEQLDYYAEARPVRRVSVKPFLVSRTTMNCWEYQPEDENAFYNELLSLGFDLISEAQWEWCAREGNEIGFISVSPKNQVFEEEEGPAVEEENGWGMEEMTLTLHELKDTYHPNYEGAPETSEAWVDNDSDQKMIRYADGMGQSTGEIIALYAASRQSPESEGERRLMFPIPCDEDFSNETASLGYEKTTEALLSGKSKTLRPALFSLQAFCQLDDEGIDVLPAFKSLFNEGLLDKKHALKVFAPISEKLGYYKYFSKAEENPQWQTDLLTNNQSFILAMLEHENVKLKPFAFSLLSGIQKPNDELKSKVIEILQTEKKADIKASALLVLGIWAKQAPELLEEIEPYLKDKKKPLKGSAACAIAVAKDAEGVSEDIYSILIETMPIDKKVGGNFKFFEGFISKGALEFVKSAPQHIREQASEIIHKNIQKAKSLKSSDVEVLLSLLFKKVETSGETIVINKLTDNQKEALITCSKAYFYSDTLFRTFGIPDCFASRRMSLGIDQESASAEYFTINWNGNECNWPIWKHIEYVSIRDKEEEYKTIKKALQKLPILTQAALFLDPRTFYSIQEGWGLRFTGFWTFLGKGKDEVFDEATKQDKEQLKQVILNAIRTKHFYKTLSYTDVIDCHLFSDLEKVLDEGEMFSEEMENLYFAFFNRNTTSLSRVIPRIDKKRALEFFRKKANDYIEEELNRNESLWAHSRGDTIAEIGILLKDIDLMRISMRLDAGRLWNKNEALDEAEKTWPELAELEKEYIAFEKKAKGRREIMEKF